MKYSLKYITINKLLTRKGFFVFHDIKMNNITVDFVGIIKNILIKHVFSSGGQ